MLSELNPPSSQVDNIITIAHSWLENETDWAIRNYRAENKKALSVHIFLSEEYFTLLYSSALILHSYSYSFFGSNHVLFFLAVLDSQMSLMTGTVWC